MPREDNNKLDVDELVEDLTEVFGTERVFYIDENTDFSKLPNPFIDNSKKQRKENRGKAKPTVRSSTDL